MAPKNQNFKYLTKHTLKPPDLRGGTVSLLIAGSDSENDGWFGGVVYVGRGQTGSCHRTSRGRATVHPHKRQLGWSPGLLVHMGSRITDRQINGVFGDLSRRVLRRFPRKMGTFRTL